MSFVITARAERGAGQGLRSNLARDLMTGPAQFYGCWQKAWTSASGSFCHSTADSLSSVFAFSIHCTCPARVGSPIRPSRPFQWATRKFAWHLLWKETEPLLSGMVITSALLPQREIQYLPGLCVFISQKQSRTKAVGMCRKHTFHRKFPVTLSPTGKELPICRKR
jgi:hypothetical protein